MALCARKRGTDKKIFKKKEKEMDKKRKWGHGVVDEIFAVGWCKMHVPKLIRHFILQTQRWAMESLLMTETKTQAKREWCIPLFSIYFLNLVGTVLQITSAYKTRMSLARISCLIRSFERATELTGISVNSGIKWNETNLSPHLFSHS